MAKLFEVGTKAQFDSLKVKDENIIYWIIDTQELYRGNTLYAVGREATETTAGLMSAEDKQLLLSLNALVSNNVNTVNTGDYGVALADIAYEPAIMDMAAIGGEIAAYSGWESDTEHYPWYDCYYDEAYSYIDANKNITIDKGQINLTEESYAQFVPFEMKRYYDGIDLSTMTISLVYITKDDFEGQGEIVNMQYGTDAIRFAWLIDEKVTHIAGDVKFEIIARGTVVDSSGLNYRAYVWKSKTGSGISVTQSLTSGKKIELDDNWMTELVNSIALRITEQVAEELASAQIDVLAANAEQAAQRAEQAASQVQSVVQAELSSVNTKIEEANVRIGEASSRIEEVNNSIPINVSQLSNDVGYLTEHQSLDEYAKKNELPIIPTNVSAFKNDAGYLTQHQSLEDYAKKDELPIIPTNISEFENDAGYLTEHQSLEGLATEDFVKDEVAKVDVSDQLKDYAKTTDLEGLASESWVTEQIAAADITDKLKDYATHEELQQAIESVDVSEQLKDYALAENVYDKTAIDNKDNAIQSGVNVNATNISNLSQVVADLQAQMENIDVDQKYTYDVAYDDAEDPDIGKNVFVLYEIENEGLENEVRTPKQKFTIVGGGGASTSSSLKIEYITKTPVVATLTDKVELWYKFSGTDSSGDNVMEGDATWTVDGQVVATGTAVYGDNHFDVTNYLVLGTQKVLLSITDAAGSLVTKTWTIQKIDVRIESTFNDTLTYPIGQVSFNYTPYGAISKDVHFILDGEEIGVVTTNASGVPTTYTLPTQQHGAHLLEVYITATVNNNTVESNHVYKDIIWYDEDSTVPVIGAIYQKFTAKQYDATNIAYVVYDPTTETPTVIRAIDGEPLSPTTLSGNSDVWQYKTDKVGQHELTITCGETVKTLKATIEKLDIDVEPVTGGLAFDFNPTGKSNNDTDRLWSYDNGNQVVSMSVSDNFDWVNGGYQIDSNGDQYFCIKAGTSAEIDYRLFADDAKKNGKEFKLIFKTTNVQSADAVFLSCMDNTTDNDHIGVEMKVHEAYIYAQAGKLHLPYSEEDVLEFEFNISKDTEDVPMIMGYEDGVSTCPLVYEDGHGFTQNTPKLISLGSDRCDLHIYRFKVYNTSLNSRGILSNFIADARNAEEMISRYNRNQIYDENNLLTPDALAKKCPHLRIIQIDAPYFTNDKDNKVGNTTIKHTYLDGDPVLDNWIATDCVHSGQGTSSNDYGPAGRNLDIIMKTYKNYGNNPVITLGDGKTKVSKVSFTRTSIPNNYFNIKVNIASSENANNALLAKHFNDFNPYKRPFVREDESIIPYIKDTMEFHNCVIFIRENDTTQDANGNYTTHREFNDTNWHFYAIGNIGDSKKTDKTRLTDPDDIYECVNEIVDYDRPLSGFPADVESLRYLEAETFDKKDFVIDGKTIKASYEWRYIWEDDEDDGKTAEVAEYCKQKWIEMYRFVTQSSNEEFKARIGEYFVLNSLLYYYLFTLRYTMVDNRAKNLFLHYGKTGEVDGDGNPIRKWDFSFNYDNDTALGIDNFGAMVYRYGYEDTDSADGTSTEVFRCSKSILFNRIRENLSDELMNLYQTLESKNAWHAETLISEFDSWQNEFPEELWRVDIERKYIRTYNSSHINGGAYPNFLKEKACGKKKYQRRQYERNQELYMASKYQTSTASNDKVSLRCQSPTGDLVVPVNYTLKLTPYAYMYLNVAYGNTLTPTQLRAEPNKEYEIIFDGDTADIVNIYSASLLKSLGDLSSCYPRGVSATTANKLTELTIGNKKEGYDNAGLTELGLGANELLEELNLANVSGINFPLSLGGLNNLKKVYAKGTNATGVTFANGGRIEEAELPAIGSFVAKNLIYLNKLDVASWNNLTYLIVENCPAIDVLNVVNNASNLNRVRLIGLDWTGDNKLENDVILNKLYNMTGIDNSGYNTQQSVLSGQVHVNLIKEKKLAEYNAAWPDLQISYNTMVQQFTVTFVNDDGSVLDVQYIDKGEKPKDPVTREDNPIPAPIKESTVSSNFTYAGWDGKFVDVFANQTFTATYTESVRQYTIKYVSMNTVLQESTDNYGAMVPYVGDIPTYTGEESGFKYYLFSGWDKSGLIDGDKTVTALYDSFEYSDGYFDDKDFSELAPVEIYGLTQMGLHSTNVVTGDSVAITLGNDINYPDIESKILIDTKTDFAGNNYVDTGISLFNEDRDFVLAIDYVVSSDSASSGVIAQCYSDNGARGFKVQYNSTIRLNWNTAQVVTAKADRREVLVIRHIKGDTNLYVYGSNAENDINNGVITRAIMENTLGVNHDSTLVFGCAKTDDGYYENNIVGTIYWSKLWYADLGDAACKELAAYPHEEMNLIVADQRRFYLADVPNKRSSITFVADKPLWNPLAMTLSTYSQSWLEANLNEYLNNKVYSGFPIQWRYLLKNCKVKSLGGKTSNDLVETSGYVVVPAASDMGTTDSNGNSLAISPYIDEISPANKCLALFSDASSRILYHENGKAVDYWLRTPCPKGNSWQFSVTDEGSIYSYQSPYTVVISEANKEYMYARIMVSI